jgi:hypothetical protein
VNAVACSCGDTSLIPSRRERIATAALQGLLARGVNWSGAGDLAAYRELVAQEAAAYADALILELDKEPGK